MKCEEGAVEQATCTLQEQAANVNDAFLFLDIELASHKVHSNVQPYEFLRN